MKSKLYINRRKCQASLTISPFVDSSVDRPWGRSEGLNEVMAFPVHGWTKLILEPLFAECTPHITSRDASALELTP